MLTGLSIFIMILTYWLYVLTRERGLRFQFYTLVIMSAAIFVLTMIYDAMVPETFLPRPVAVMITLWFSWGILALVFIFNLMARMRSSEDPFFKGLMHKVMALLLTAMQVIFILTNTLQME